MGSKNMIKFIKKYGFDTEIKDIKESTSKIEMEKEKLITNNEKS